MTTISQLLYDYEEAKEEVKTAAKKMTQRAVEEGCDEKSAQDARLAYAYLAGLTRRKK